MYYSLHKEMHTRTDTPDKAAFSPRFDTLACRRIETV